MKNRQSSSMEQKKYVASVCPEYRSAIDVLSNGNSSDIGIISCEGCVNWDNGRCAIFDEVLTGIDQT